MNRNSLPHTVPRQTITVPGFPNLTITVYGKTDATTLPDRMEQGYFVELDGQPTARAELLDREKAAVRAVMEERFPQHAKI